MKIVKRIILFVIFLELFLRGGSLISVSMQNMENQLRLRDKYAYRIMCVGDSMTFDGGYNSYPAQLTRMLNDNQDGRAFEVITRGTPASTSADVLARFESDLDQYKPEVVVALIGVMDNERTVMYKDSLSDKLRVSIGRFRVGAVFKMLLRSMLQRAKRFHEDLMPAQSPGEEADKTMDDFMLKISKGTVEPEPLDKYLEYAEECEASGQFDKQEQVLKHALNHYGGNLKLDLKMAAFYEMRDDYLAMEKHARRALANSAPQFGPMVSSILAKALFKQGKFAQAERIYAKLLARARFDRANYFNILGALTELFVEKGDFDNTEVFFTRQVKLQPQKPPALNVVVHGYRRNNLYERLETLLRSVHPLIPSTESPYLSVGCQLGYILYDNQRYDEAEEVFKEVLKAGRQQLSQSPSESKEYTAEYEIRQAKQGLAMSMNARQGRLPGQEGEDYFLAATRYNYRRIQAIAHERNLVLIVVQYPMRSIKSLEKLFAYEPSMILVDNNESFRKGIAKEGYDAYFVDRVHGESGHCTPKGYRIIARNVLRVILDQFSGK